MRFFVHTLSLLTLLLLSWSSGAVAQTLMPQVREIDTSSGRYVLPKSPRVYTNLTTDNRAWIDQLLSEIHGLQPQYVLSSEGAALRLIKTSSAKPTTVPYDVAQQSYQLTVSAEGIQIESPSEAGLYHGFHTLLQLFESRGISYLQISDGPDYPYRGLMIDSSRHFWSIDFLKKQIDLMARLKLNHLHLHLTDAGGWRMQSHRYPALTQRTAYRTHSDWQRWWVEGDRRYLPEHTTGAYGGYYTQAQLRDLVKYAQQRFVTIVPEIDIPGHSNEVNYAYPELSCDGQPNADLCIGTEATFAFIEGILDEVMEIFPSPYIHMGGDEAEGTHWQKCPKCQTRMREHHLADTHALQAYMMKRVSKYLHDHGRRMIGWDEMTQAELPEGVTIMAWRSADYGIDAAKRGHQVIMSPEEVYYLNYYQNDPTQEPTAAGGYAPLQATYAFDPTPRAISGTQVAQKIIGVQGNLWTEVIDTEQHAEYMIYPRLFAIAETGWHKGHKGYADFASRSTAFARQIRNEGYHPFDLSKATTTRLESRQRIEHQARGKQVHYTTPYSPKYPGSSATTLTDGWLGDYSFKGSRWQGFVEQQSMDIYVDMGATTNIHDISVSFMQFLDPWIRFPSTITLLVSDDGSDYRQIDSQVYAPNTAQYTITPYEWRGDVQARYVRIRATVAEPGIWIFTDEVIINRQ